MIWTLEFQSFPPQSLSSLKCRNLLVFGPSPGVGDSGSVHVRVPVVPEDAVGEEELLRAVPVALHLPEEEQPADGEPEDEDDGEADGDAAQRPGVPVRRLGLGTDTVLVDHVRIPIGFLTGVNIIGVQVVDQSSEWSSMS